LGKDEYYEVVLIGPRSREGLPRQPFRGGADGSERKPILKVEISLEGSSFIQELGFASAKIQLRLRNL
jgi:hypothetical protein